MGCLKAIKLLLALKYRVIRGRDMIDFEYSPNGFVGPENCLSQPASFGHKRALALIAAHCLQSGLIPG